MNSKLKTFIQQYHQLLVILGITLLIGGIALAYFTGNEEPWGTIGGILSAIGLLTLMAGYANKDQESK